MIVRIFDIFGTYTQQGLTTVDYQDKIVAGVQSTIQGTADWLVTPGAANQSAALPSQPGKAADILSDANKAITLTGSQS